MVALDLYKNSAIVLVAGDEVETVHGWWFTISV